MCIVHLTCPTTSHGCYLAHIVGLGGVRCMTAISPTTLPCSHHFCIVVVTATRHVIARAHRPIQCRSNARVERASLKLRLNRSRCASLQFDHRIYLSGIPLFLACPVHATVFATRWSVTPSGRRPVLRRQRTRVAHPRDSSCR
jgi:hypothetical protein